MVRRSTKGQGIDASRRPNREYEPNSEVANLGRLKRVIHPTEQPVEHLRGVLETWEREYQTYTERIGEMLSAPVRHFTLHSMCLPALQEHLDFHVTRLGTNDLFRLEVDSFVNRKLALQPGGATELKSDSVFK